MKAAIKTITLMTMMLMLASFGFAQSLDITLDTYTVETCPYSTKMITGEITNNGNIQTQVKVYSNSNWITIAQDSFVLAPGESKSIDIFITPTDEAKTMTYTAKIYAYSDELGEVSDIINIDILDCGALSFEVPEEYKRIDACIGDTLKIPFDIVNNGKQTEIVSLYTDRGVLEFYETELYEYEKDRNYLYYKVEKDYDIITLKARSQNTFANAEQKIYVNGENCYNFKTTVVPQSVDICMSDKAVFDIYVENTGTHKNTIKLDSSFGVLSETSITLQPGESQKITLTARPEKEGETAIKVTVSDKIKKEERDLQIFAQRCSEGAMIIVPRSMEVCQGSAARYVIGIRNTGELDENILLKSNIGELETDTLEVKAGDIAYVELYVNTQDMDYGTYKIEINLSSESKRLFDTIDGNLTVKNCYNGEISSPYKEVKACKLTPTDEIPIIVKNTGERTETYYVSGKYGYFEKESIKLEPNEEATLSYHINLSGDIAEGRIQDTITLTGMHITKPKTLTLDVDVMPEDACSNFTVSIEPLEVTATAYKGYIYKVKVKNYGLAENSFTLNLKDDYGMIYVEPEKITLKRNDEGVFFIYVAPNSKMPNKPYAIEGTVKDKFGNEKAFKATFTLEVEKSQIAEGAQQDKLIVSIKDLDTEKIYIVNQTHDETLTIRYVMGYEEYTEEILFTAGSFIIQIGDELYEDKTPEIGRKTYIINANNKTYKITVKFVYVDNAQKEYKFKIENIVIEKEIGAPIYEAQPAQQIDWSKYLIWLIPLVVLIIGLVLIANETMKYRKAKNKKSKKKPAKKKEIEELKKAIEK